MTEASAVSVRRPPLPEWDNLGFNYIETDCFYVARGSVDAEPMWGEGEFLPLQELPIHPAAAFMSYGQAVFEGLKARRTDDGRVLLFRPEANAARFQRSARRLAMEAFPAERFVDAVVELVHRNLRFVPPPDKGSLYIRPMQHGVDLALGFRPCTEFLVSMYASPVGSYFGGPVTGGVRLRVVEQSRVADGGTGNAKAAANYAGAIEVARPWKKKGFHDVLFLDPRQARYVTETSGSNFFAVLRDGTIVTPPIGDQILPGITRDSTIRVARDLGMTVEERHLPIEEVVHEAVEVFCTGTAWTIQNVTFLSWKDVDREIPRTETRDALFAVLDGIQYGRREDPYGWVREVPQD